MMNGQETPQQIRVVVVDDEEDTLDSICQTLEIGGIDVIGKGVDGEEAYQLYKTLAPDLIILDMNMPNYDGGYALEKITQDFPDAKTIVVTAFTDYTFEKAKTSAILTKPYDFQVLIDTVKNVAKNKITSLITE